MLGLTVKEAKSAFFDAAIIEAATDKAALRNLAQSAGFVMTTARRSIRKARRKKLSELTPNERRRYEILLRAYNRGESRYKPRLPDAPSKPGEPPREHPYDSHDHSPLRRLLFFAYDTATGSAVVGPAVFSPKKGPAGSVPGILERGGQTATGTIAPRPYMVPAYEKERARSVDVWKNSITP